MATYDVFLAHNSSDKPAVERLATKLRDERGLEVWFDKWCLRPGLSWLEGMEDGIRSSHTTVVCIGREGLGPWQREEMKAVLNVAVQEQRPVVPVIFRGAPDEPIESLFLANRHAVSLRGGLTDDAIDQLVWGITGKNPHESSRDTRETSDTAHDESSAASDHSESPTETHATADVPVEGLETLRTYGAGFAGRTAELAALDAAWTDGARICVWHAGGGAGKTRVVVQWLNGLRDDGWRDAGRVFVHSFYSQGSDERRNAGSELVFQRALAFFGYSGPPILDHIEQGRTLARLLVQQHGLLVLDGLEPLQHPPAIEQGRLKDPAVRSLLTALGGAGPGEGRGGLCLITSRQPVVELADKTGRTVLQQPLDELDDEAGAELLRQLGVEGTERDLHEAVADAHGHA